MPDSHLDAWLSHRHHVVIVGGGFGGLHAAKALRRAPLRVTLIDRRNFHLFQPLLYQVATGGLSPANICAPLRKVLRKQENARVFLGDVQTVDPHARRLTFRECDADPAEHTLTYDSLIVAAGARNGYFARNDWAQHAPGLKSVEDATDIRGRILSAFESAELEPDEIARRSWLTFVVIGGGPTGVELAGTLAEIARHTLRSEFRRIDSRAAQVTLVEAAERILPGLPADLSERARRSLERIGVSVRTATRVLDLQRMGVLLRLPGGGEQFLPSRVCLWAAGVRGAALGERLAIATGVELDRAERIPVTAGLTVRGFPDIFVIGDLARCEGADGAPLPGVAPVAMQQGDFAARCIVARVLGEDPPPAFRYRDPGTMATIGRAAAVVDLRGTHLWGLPAWLVWLLVHILALIEFENRLLVLLQWAWNYFTWGRSARLITESRAKKREPAG